MRYGLTTRVALAALVGLLVAACGTEQEPTPTPPRVETPPGAVGQEAWEAEWEAAVAGAQEEGALVLVGGSAALYYRPVWERFEQQFGIEVNSSGGSASQLVDRLLAERNAGRYTVDIFLGGPGTMIGRMIPNNVLDPVADAFILPEVKDESLWFEGRHMYRDAEQTYLFSYAANVEVEDNGARYNTEYVSEQEISSVSSQRDFLDPRWKGRMVSLAIEPRPQSGRELFHPDLGIEFLEHLFLEMDILFLGDSRLVVDHVLTGARPVCFPCGSIGRDLDRLEREGAPLSNLRHRHDEWQDDKLMNTQSPGHTISKMNRPAHPNAQTVFINWLLSKEGQTARHVLTPAVETPPMSLRLDVTEMGNTLAGERWVAGESYMILHELPDYDEAVAGEVMYGLYLQAVGR